MPNPEPTVNIDGEQPLRISVGVTPYDRWGGIQPILSAAKRADELGYSAVSFPDHMVMPVTPGRDPVIVTWYDDFVLAAAVAAATQRIRMVFTHSSSRTDIPSIWPNGYQPSTLSRKAD